MAATINGKRVLANERILFFADQNVKFDGVFPLVIRANTGSLDLGIVHDGGEFVLEINGMSQQNFDRLAKGSGTASGQAFGYAIHATMVGDIDSVALFDVGFTIYEK